MARGTDLPRLGRTMLTVALAGVAALAPHGSASAGPSPRQQPGQCAVVVSSGRCLVQAADPGRLGGPAAAEGPGRPLRQPASATRNQAAFALPATRDQADDLADEIQRALGVVDPPEELPPVAPGPAQAAAQAAADPAVPAQIAINELDLDAPVIRFSGGDPAFVGVPIWLWLDGVDELPPRATAAVGAARVTATAQLTAVEWTLGPPGAAVVCRGAGTPWTGQEGPSPDCGYSYTARSLPERTGDSGRFPVTATAVWQVEWQGVSAGAPVAGGEELRLTTETSIAVDEVQTLVVGEGE